MNRREKMLAIVVGLCATLLGGALFVNFLFVKPLRDMDKKNAALRERLEKIKAEKRAYFVAEDLVQKLTRQTFADQVDKASAKSGEELTHQIAQSGLSETEFSRLPVGPRKLRGANEIGWSVQGQGRLENIVNLLFLLQESPYLHRVQNLTVSPGDNPGLVRARFQFLTLVIDPAPVVEFTNQPPKYALSSPERRMFDAIVFRDILRPYVRRPPSNPGSSSVAESSRPNRRPSGPESLKIVSLTEWQGQPEVHVRDLNAQKILRFKPGDTFGGGQIVMVDYRSMPMPGNPALKSFSRVILKVGSEYWAIEGGQTLAEKHALSPEQLPENLPGQSK
jgi:hypothetical protein